MDAHPDDFGTTNVTVSIATLIGAGLLPANFGNRTGVTPAASITPFGQPYLVIARRLDADDDRATAIILESGTVSRDKLAQVGIEDEADDDDAAIFALKQEIAARANRSYSLISGAVPTGSSNVQGTNGAFTKDIASYLSSGTGGGVAEAKTVAFVNFADLDPTMGDDTPVDPLANVPWRKEWWRCEYVKNTIPGSGNRTLSWLELGGQCSSPLTYRPSTGPDPEHPLAVYDYRTDPVGTCDGTTIVTTEFGGTLTNGWSESTIDEYTSPSCPGATQLPPDKNCTFTRTMGRVTMNTVVIADSRCKDSFREEDPPAANVLTYDATTVGVCCQYRWVRP